MQGVTFGPRDPYVHGTQEEIFTCAAWCRGPASGEEAMGLVGLEVGVQVCASAKVHLPTTLGCCTQKRRMDVEEEGRTRR